MKSDKKAIMKERTDIVRSMNTLVSHMNDESAYLAWIYLVPDCASEDDFEYIAGDDSLYAETCTLFRKLMKNYGCSGFFVWGDNMFY